MSESSEFLPRKCPKCAGPTVAAGEAVEGEVFLACPKCLHVFIASDFCYPPEVVPINDELYSEKIALLFDRVKRWQLVTMPDGPGWRWPQAF